jgi:transcriptional regulator of acetoin/glycerol metabolism
MGWCGSIAIAGSSLLMISAMGCRKVLQECRGNKSKAARRLGLSRTQLHLRIRKYRLEEPAIA